MAKDKKDFDSEVEVSKDVIAKEEKPVESTPVIVEASDPHYGHGGAYYVGEDGIRRKVS